MTVEVPKDFFEDAGEQVSQDIAADRARLEQALENSPELRAEYEKLKKASDAAAKAKQEARAILEKAQSEAERARLALVEFELKHQGE